MARGIGAQLLQDAHRDHQPLYLGELVDAPEQGDVLLGGDEQCVDAGGVGGDVLHTVEWLVRARAVMSPAHVANGIAHQIVVLNDERLAPPNYASGTAASAA